jgi:DNA-binding NarL/FixJ family response regulator
VFSAKSEKQLARGLLKVGVRGYVPKSARLSELRQAVDAVAAGDTWFSDSFQKAMADALTAPESDVDAKGSTLTEREKEIAILLAKSFSSKEVAVKLDISAKTVENHRTNLMRKLGVHDVAGVIRYVVRQGLYDPSEG